MMSPISDHAQPRPRARAWATSKPSCRLQKLNQKVKNSTGKGRDRTGPDRIGLDGALPSQKLPVHSNDQPNSSFHFLSTLTSPRTVSSKSRQSILQQPFHTLVASLFSPPIATSCLKYWFISRKSIAQLLLTPLGYSLLFHLLVLQQWQALLLLIQYFLFLLHLVVLDPLVMHFRFLEFPFPIPGLISFLLSWRRRRILDFSLPIVLLMLHLLRTQKKRKLPSS